MKMKCSAHGMIICRGHHLPYHIYIYKISQDPRSAVGSVTVVFGSVDVTFFGVIPRRGALLRQIRYTLRCLSIRP